MMKFNATIDLVILIIGYYDQLIENLTELVGSYREIKEYDGKIEQNKKAKELGVEILAEQDFMDRFLK